MQTIEVDGSLGEGGGQILRTAVAFSAIRGAPVRVTKIRAGRAEPGLRRQHVSALRILARVFGGELEGAEEGSSAVSFVPGRPSKGRVEVDMGTAASITLVLQAVVPAVALGRSRLEIELTGGTDVPWSPTFDYFSRVVVEGYRRLGIKVEVEASQRGYYPRGGGAVRAVIEPCDRVAPLDLTSALGVSAASVVSRCGGLPRSVAERQADSAAESLRREGMTVDVREVFDGRAASPGTSILVYNAKGDALLGADSIGAKGRPAEEVGRAAASRFVEVAKTGSSLDENLADMLVPLLSLSDRESHVRIPGVTPHLESGLRLAEQFTSCAWISKKETRSTVVSMFPGGLQGPASRHNV